MWKMWHQVSTKKRLVSSLGTRLESRRQLSWNVHVLWASPTVHCSMQGHEWPESIVTMDLGITNKFYQAGEFTNNGIPLWWGSVVTCNLDWRARQGRLLDNRQFPPHRPPWPGQPPLPSRKTHPRAEASPTSSGLIQNVHQALQAAEHLELSIVWWIPVILPWPCSSNIQLLSKIPVSYLNV